MPAVWTQLAFGEQAATAGAGAANAAYFGRRAIEERGPRRLAAALLAGLFAGGAGQAMVHAAHGTADPGVVLADAPFLAANLGVFVLVALGRLR